jgi:cobalt-zinc-cadmium efflux system membrane fusion protein
MKSITQRLVGALQYVRLTSLKTWKWFRGQKLWKQIAIGALLVALLVGLVLFLTSLGKTDAAGDHPRTVTLASAGSLSGTGDGANVLGTVRSVTEASLLAESGGTVRSVRTTLGASVPAGFVIAELENAAQRASVLQAEGNYDAAIAGRSSVSPTDTSASVRNTYRAAYSAIDSALSTQVDSVYGDPTPLGPQLLINAVNPSPEHFSRARDALSQRMSAWRAHQATAASTDPGQLLDEAQGIVDSTSSLLNDLTRAASESNSTASASQAANLAAARATVNAQQTALASSREAYRSKSVGSTASVDASVKIALGALRGAQAQLEKTLVRAPIGGTVNFLPIRVGDYVTQYLHVATVAQNGSLEIVTSVSEDERTELSVGDKVRIDSLYTGVITSIAPALDPSTRQIEVHIAVTDSKTALLNGQSVHITLPGAVAVATADQGPLMLPLAAVKLRAGDRLVFSVNEEGRLVAHLVTVGDVRGNRIEILSGLTPETRIVTDARGLSEGQKVTIASI